MNDEITPVVRHKWGKIGPPYLFSERGDLSFLLYFSKQYFVGNIQGKFFFFNFFLIFFLNVQQLLSLMNNLKCKCKCHSRFSIAIF